jgi:tRNA threonylcarbamoyladenosine biosynthesis protein TsaE
MSPSETDAAEESIFLPDERATRLLGEALASACTPGSVVLLDGPLGAGKTTLVAGFARAIGATDAASPSFVIAHRYAGGRMPVWHLDLYRIENPAEIEDLDLDQYLPADGVALVEWAGRAVMENWPDDRVEIDIAFERHGRRARVRGLRKGADVVRRMSRARNLA